MTLTKKRSLLAMLLVAVLALSAFAIIPTQKEDVHAHSSGDIWAEVINSTSVKTFCEQQYFANPNNFDITDWVHVQGSIYYIETSDTITEVTERWAHFLSQVWYNAGTQFASINVTFPALSIIAINVYLVVTTVDFSVLGENLMPLNIYGQFQVYEYILELA